MGFQIKTKGNFNFKRSKKYLNKLTEINLEEILHYYGRKGVERLYDATPKSSGKTASSWSYEVTHDRDGYHLEWHNSNTRNGQNVALLIRYGYATKSGYRVMGNDYINPALQPIYKEITNAIEEGVRRS